jgi:hypothetical protein
MIYAAGKRGPSNDNNLSGFAADKGDITHAC